MNKRMPRQQGSALMVAMIFITLITMMAGSYLDAMIDSNTGTAFIGNSPQAFYSAEAGAHRLLDQMENGGAATVSGSFVNSTYTGSYSASYDSGTNIVTSTGTVVGSVVTATRTVSVRVKPVPAYVRGALSSNGSATIKDSAVCDGRDHDANGDLTGAAGTYGLSAAGTVTQEGASMIGGNGNAPANPAAASSIEENATAFASTEPSVILGLVDETDLTTNYVTPTTTAPTLPFNGIVYYKPPAGTTWENVDLSDCTGILIVHNDAGNARIKDITTTSGHPFKGLIICDKMRQESGTGTIIGGAIVTNVVQNKGGSLEIKYSRSVITDLQSLVGNRTSNWKKVPQDSSWTETAQ